MKLCECGCGEPAPLASQTSSAEGIRKGEPRRFIHGHVFRTLPPELHRRLAEGRRGAGNPMYGRTGERAGMYGRRAEHAPAWKGDDANYHTIHEWVRRWYPKSGVCEECGETAKTDWANVSGEYRREDRSDWRELCKSCHAKADNWVSHLRQSA